MVNFHGIVELEIANTPIFSKLFYVPRNPENAAVATRVFQFVQAGKKHQENLTGGSLLGYVVFGSEAPLT